MLAVCRLQCAPLIALLWTVRLVSAQTPAPIDWTDWERYRGQVEHPVAAIRPADLERARRNVERYGWAREYVQRLRQSADATTAQTTPAYLEQMIPRTTPGCVGPCPACRAQGLPWHPNGQWSWSPEGRDDMTMLLARKV